jgi:hypothetical protein
MIFNKRSKLLNIKLNFIIIDFFNYHLLVIVSIYRKLNLFKL